MKMSHSKFSTYLLTPTRNINYGPAGHVTHSLDQFDLSRTSAIQLHALSDVNQSHVVVKVGRIVQGVGKPRAGIISFTPKEFVAAPDSSSQGNNTEMRKKIVLTAAAIQGKPEVIKIGE